MAFIRIKHHHQKRYAYLVESVWNAKKHMPEQKVQAYLGQVVKREKSDTPSPVSLPGDYSTSLRLLVRLQCQRHGLDENAEQRYWNSQPIQRLQSFRVSSKCDVESEEGRLELEEEHIELFATLYHQSGLPKEPALVIALYQQVPKQQTSSDCERELSGSHADGK